MKKKTEKWGCMRDDIEHNNKQQKECIAIMFDTRSCVVFIMSLSILYNTHESDWTGTQKIPHHNSSTFPNIIM